MKSKIEETLLNIIQNAKILLIKQQLFQFKYQEKDKLDIKLNINKYNQILSERLKQNFSFQNKAFVQRKKKLINNGKNILKNFIFKMNLMIYYFFLLSLICRINAKNNFRINYISYSYEVTLKVNGVGTKTILGSSFTSPNQVYLNGVSKTLDSNKQIYVDDAGKQIKLVWSSNTLDSLFEMFKGCNEITEIDLSNFDTTSITDMSYMFDGCSSLTLVNLNRFNTRSVRTFRNMFYNCLSLKSIDLSSFRTPSAVILWSMFENCIELTSIDLSQFDTSQVTDFDAIFKGCVKLEYINLNNFNDHIQEWSREVFDSIPQNAVICLYSNKAPTLYSLASQISCITFYCSSNWRGVQKKIVPNSDICVTSCSTTSYIYEYLGKCYSICPSGTLASNKICYDCNSNCKECVNSISYCTSCKDSSKFLNNGNCVSSCTYGYYTENSIKKCCNLPKCSWCSKTSLNSDLCTACYTGYYTKYDDRTKTIFDCYNNLDGYYLDKTGTHYYFKQCYSRCKKCGVGGNDNLHNCIECKSDYNFEIVFGSYKNCYVKCDNYYYLDNNNQLYCTQSKNCPAGYSKLIKAKNECVNNCNKYSNYKYEYMNECFNECPVKTKAFNSNICVPAYKYNNIDYEVCPSNTKTDNEVMECYDECLDYKFEYESTCLTNCPTSTYRFLINRKICLKNLLENYYLDGNDNIYKVCHQNCKKCFGKGDEANNNCKECKSGFMFLSEPNKDKTCFECVYYYYIGDSNKFFCTNSFACPQNHKNFIPEKKKCINICKNDDKYKYEYNNTCYIECPRGTKSYESNICIQLYEYIKNNTYYRECPSIFKIDHEDKKCYDECPEYKFEYNNSCWTNCPINTYRYFIDRKKCLETILENYYLDGNDNIYKECHKNCKKCYGKGNETNNNCKECKTGFIFLYEPNQDNNCFNCSYYYYIEGANNFRCTESIKCPNKHKKFILEKKKCINLCQYDSIYKLDYNGNCTIKCPNGTYISDDKTLCINDDASDADIFERKIENAINMIMNAGFGYNDSIGIMAFKISDDFSIFAGTTDDMKNNSNKNSSSFDLGNCTDELKAHYNLSENHTLVVVLKNYKPKEFLIPKIDYEILDPINSMLLNLSYCDASKATVYVPVNIDKNEEYLYNPSSSYYNDICYSFTTENGTDITQKDRQDKFVNNKLFICDNNCKYEGYDDFNQQSICTCDIQNKPETIEDLMNEEVQRPEEFISDEESNLIATNKMKCLSLDGLKTTILSYILIIITLYFLFSIVFFVKCGFPKLKMDINRIIATKERENLKKTNNQMTCGNNFKFNNKLYNIKKRQNNNSPPIKGKVRFMSNEMEDKRYHRVLKSGQNALSSVNRLNLFNIINSKNHKEQTKNKIIQNKRNIPSKNTSLKNIKNNIPKYYFSDYELNIMIYQEACLYDKRSCCKYYFSLLKMKHPFLFAFCPFKDYNTFIIKSCIFFLSIAFYLFTNFILFDEDVIHKLYEDGGEYKIIYFIPKISISFGICHVLTIMTKYIFLSESNIIEIKRQKSLIVAHRNTSKVISRLRCKYIFFFLLGTIFLIACWAFLSSFGVVYKNSELILLKNTSFSFSISFIYPFFINIFPSLFRICSLSTKRHNLGCIYGFSKLLQII